jgi:exodeoxyribonuclease VII small subunit
VENEDEKTSAELRFQDGLRALDQIVGKLESGDLSLEDALGAYEEGVRLVRLLQQKLGEAEQRIEILSRADDGTPRLRPWKEDKR